jgi:transcriptional regulator with XRE-family HTH domain
MNDLATASGIATRTIHDFENGAREPHQSTLDALRSSLERAGVSFISIAMQGAQIGGVGLKESPEESA